MAHQQPDEDRFKSELSWVPISKIRVSPTTQRKINAAKSGQIAAEFNPALLGYPVVVYDPHNDVYWIQDGQHRIEAMKLLGWDDQKAECQVYTDLTEKERAELFLGRNNTKVVNPFDKFKIAVTAGRPMECDIVRIVDRLDLTIGQAKGRGLRAVTALKNVYTTIGGEGLTIALRVIRDAYGARGFDSAVINGMGEFIQRYGPKINEERLTRALAERYGGLNALLAEADLIQQKRKYQKAPRPVAIGEALLTFYNESAKAGRLPVWTEAA